ncbi:DUF6544 family protein [Pleomorphovibrio marinus]|uniref:DUF6544 family protein n=1 Tax=Pleomorphovibrio marinus TaxID=2164132 RepID=UPI000E0B1F7B|nr:DUF6544 family protein [Pleomorphovibrio marinus]
MKTVFLIIVILHGLIHLLGFVKAFEIAEVKALEQHITRGTGSVWIFAALLFLAFGLLYYLNSAYAGLVGLLAVIISQGLIIYFWQDAKFGTIPNVLILITAFIAMGNTAFTRQVNLETSTLLGNTLSTPEKLLKAADIVELPEPVQQWLHHSGAVGKPMIRVAKVVQKAEMQLNPGQKGWNSATAIQYSTVEEPAFLWEVNVQMNPFLVFRGRDKFVDGKGEMWIKMSGLVDVVKEKGEKIDEGSLQRYLGELVWFPSLALSDYITWETLDETSVKATMNYKGTTGSGIFHFNTEGEFVRFSAMRFRGNEKDAQRKEWVLEVEDYQSFQGIRVPSKMSATWRLDEGDWTWLKLEIVDIRYNDISEVHDN